MLARMVQLKKKGVMMMYIPHLEPELPKQTEADKEAMYQFLAEMGFDLEPPKETEQKKPGMNDGKE